MTRAPKKTVKLEVRLSPEAKASFLARCQSQGDSASEAVRRLITRRLARPIDLKGLPMSHRAVVLLCGLVATGFALVSLASAVFALDADLRAGLIAFLVVQSAVYAVAAVAVFWVKWRLLSWALLVQCLLQTVYAAEVNPAAPSIDALMGIVVGMLTPTIALAGACVLAWVVSHKSLLGMSRRESKSLSSTSDRQTGRLI